MANPEKDNFQVDPEMSKKMKNIAKEMRHNPLLRITGSVIYAITMVYFLSSTPEGRRQLKNPEFRKTLIDKEKRTGLLEDTILSPYLYHPNDEGTSLTKSEAKPGRWISYDFRRPKEFYPKKVPQLDNGRIFAFVLPEVIDNPTEKFTPTNLVNIFEITHILTVETPSISELVTYGYIKETTYGKAYEEAGTSGKFDKYLALNDLTNKQIYQITPKGNGMVFLATDSGETNKEEQRIKKLVPLTNL